VASVEEDASGVPTRWIASLLVGPENTRDYAVIGVIRWDRRYPSPQFFLKKGTSPTPATQGFVWLLDQLYNPKAPNHWGQVEMYHMGACGRCGRPLTDPESIQRGLGPICASKS
jgi:hypothetical protein